jgi:signal transduction histidine kinase/DNA-binding response OmpR family regulator
MDKLLNKDNKMKRKILVIDNSPVTLKLITSLLEKEGHEVASAVDGLSGLEVLKSFSPELIFLDLIMPNIDGFELCRIIRHNLKMTDTMLVIISATILEDDVDIAALGVNACIAKGPKMSNYILKIANNPDKELFSAKYLGLEDIHFREITKELLKSKKHFQNILANMTEGVFEFTSDYIIIYSNDTACSLCNIEKTSLLSSLFLDLFKNENRQIVHDKLKSIESSPLFIDEFNPVILNGREVTITFLPILLEERTIIALLKDVTEKRKIEKKLIAAKNAAEDANRSKGQFLANMSHELRTPMNGIIGFTDMILNMDISDQQRKYLELVKSSADRLLNVMSDILDFSKIEAGRLTMETMIFRFRITLDDILNFLILKAEKKGLKVSWEISNEVPDNLIGDPTRFSQIITNLVGNAIKFTEQGAVEIKVSVKEKISNAVLLHFTIKDTGIGIPQDKQDTVFDSFSQAENSHTRKYGGTGLGLAITSKLVNMMEGNIWFESVTKSLQAENDISQNRTGTTFHFTVRFNYLPAEDEQEKIKKSEKYKKIFSEQVSGLLNILIAEDELINRTLIVSLLEEKGWQITEVTNGEEALEALNENNFDLIIMDVQMPKLNGFEATQAIRENEKDTGQHIPIIATTAFALKGDREKCLEAGMDEYLSKPINIEKLMETISRLVS